MISCFEGMYVLYIDSICLQSNAYYLGLCFIFLRRNLEFFGNAELGGEAGPKYLSGIFLFSLWILFVVIVSAHSYNLISNPFNL